MKRKGFFSALREQQYEQWKRERQREDMEGDGVTKANELPENPEQGGSGKGEESGTPVEIILEGGPSTKEKATLMPPAALGGNSKVGEVQLEPDLEELIKPSTSTSRPQDFVGADKTVQEATSTSKTPIFNKDPSHPSIKTRYDYSARLFVHDLRNGNYSTSKFLHLLIRHVTLREDKLVQTLAYDLIENQDRWILFKPDAADADEMMEGTQVKIYPPWRKNPVTVTPSMIICTDFYKRCGWKGKSDKLLEDKLVKKLMQRPMPALPEEVPVEGPTLTDLVPYRIKNKRTLASQMDFSVQRCSIDVLLVQAWTKISPALYLIKDSDEFFSFLEVPQGNGVMKVLGGGGKFFRLEGIDYWLEVRIGKNISPFSVLHLFGGNKQMFYFPLKWVEGKSTCVAKDFLEIPKGPAGPGEMKIIDEIYGPGDKQEQRICLRCWVKEKGPRAILVTDEVSDGSLRIEFEEDRDFKMEGCEAPVGAEIFLKFLRNGFGKTIWDKFTICEEDNTGKELVGV